MNILLVYDDKSMVGQTQKIIGEHNLILCEYCNLENMTEELIDIVIMDFDSKRINERRYMPILSVNGIQKFTVSPALPPGTAEDSFSPSAYMPVGVLLSATSPVSTTGLPL